MPTKKRARNISRGKSQVARTVSISGDIPADWHEGSGNFKGLHWNGKKWVKVKQRAFKNLSRARATITIEAQTPRSNELASEDLAVRMAGTTTSSRNALRGLFESHQLASGGLLEVPAQLVAEPKNPKDPNAIAIKCEGERIGYLPGYMAASFSLPHGSTRKCVVQLWGEIARDQLRVIGWVYSGTGKPKWPHTISNPPPISIEAERAAHTKFLSKLVEAELTGHDPNRVARWAAGLVGGKHYLELIEPIKEMKRQGRLEEALLLCYAGLEAAEKGRGADEYPNPTFTIDAAIVLRKLGRTEEEISVLERWLDHCPKNHKETNFAQVRLKKLRRRISSKKAPTKLEC